MFYDWACSYRCMVKIVSTCNQTRVWEAESIFDHPVLRTNICDRLNAPEQRLSIHNFNISPNQRHLQDIWDTINLLTRTRGREEIKAACVSCISFNQTSHFYTPPPCHPFQVDTFPPPLHPQSLPLPPLYPPLLPAHCCHPLPPHCHPNKQEKKQTNSYSAFQSQSVHSQTGWLFWSSALTSSSLPSSSSPSSDSSLSSKNLDLESPAALEDKEEQEGPASPSPLPAFSSPLELPEPPQSAAVEEKQGQHEALHKRKTDSKLVEMRVKEVCAQDFSCSKINSVFSAHYPASHNTCFFIDRNITVRDSKLHTWTAAFTSSCSPTGSQLRPACSSFAFFQLPIALLFHLSIYPILLLPFPTFAFVSCRLGVRACRLLGSRTKNKTERGNKEESNAQPWRL